MSKTAKNRKAILLRGISLIVCGLMGMSILASCESGGDTASSSGTSSSGTSSSGTSSSGTSSSGTSSSATDSSSSSGGNTSTKVKKYDNEKTSVTFSVGELDGVFNPYFSTSAYDGEIVGLTQISMLSSDAYGAVAYGQDEPVMTLDMTTTMYTANGQVTTSGSSSGKTEYKFLIKNGVKDSNGYPITIDDILFNIYVYLDPVYNGSSTMYSTDIVGLSDYQTGKVGSNKNDANAQTTLARNNARTTLQNIVAYANWKGDTTGSNNYTDPTNGDETVQAQYDEYIKKLYSLFNDMIESDWKNCVNGLETAQETYLLVDPSDVATHVSNPRTYEITSAWEYFCIEEGLSQSVQIGDSYKTDEETPRYYVAVDQGIYNDIAEQGADKAQEICFDAMKKEYTSSYSQVTKLVNGFSVGDDFLNYLQEIALGEINEGDEVKSISGITTEKVTEFNGVEYATEHDVLTIVINGVDPKAIWNFAFTVAPMRYYASEEQFNLFDGVEHFGIIKKDTTYRDTYLKDSTRMGLPVGGGSYMASNASGNPTTSPTEFKSNNIVYYQRNPYFYTLGIDCATATEADLAKSASEAKTAINNAKIKYIRYKVVPSSSLFESMKAGEIDYSSEISAKLSSITSVNEVSSLSYALQANNGYGYIGINPKYVQDIEVRRLIMYAIDRDYITENYYTDGLGSIIERPMSTNSWAYPEDAETYYTQEWFIKHYKDDLGITLTASADRAVFVENALKKLGYSKSGGVYQKTLADGKTVSKLDYTFTIAGETKDHPAYGVFQDVAEALNGIIKITVKTDALALSKLSNGQLTVWAAAWSSAIDPDMYQVYHKYSQATSVNNWGYSTILNDSSDLYKTERSIIDDLSDLIDLGRTTLKQNARKVTYSQALDTVMELAVELPTYQRSNLLVYNNTKIDPDSLTPVSELTAYRGLIDKIWELDLL